jgi:hypothetical protein
MIVDVLTAALLTLFPGYFADTTDAQTHVAAAIAASTATGIDPDVLLAIAYVESRYNPKSVSRVECHDGVCARKTGVWEKDTKPPGAKPTYYCGVTQVGGNITWAKCVELRDIDEAYLTGAIHLDSWMNSKPCRKLTGEARLTCGLRGYNGGWASIEKRAQVYPGMVYGAREKIREACQATAPEKMVASTRSL